MPSGPVPAMVHMMRDIGGVGHMKPRSWWWMPAPPGTALLLVRATPALLLGRPQLLPLLGLFRAVEPGEARYTATILVPRAWHEHGMSHVLGPRLAAPHLLGRTPAGLKGGQI